MGTAITFQGFRRGKRMFQDKRALEITVRMRPATCPDENGIHAAY
jgi:hypothetical protein